MNEDIKTVEPDIDIDATLFTLNEVATLLKMNPFSVWRWTKSGKLKAIKVGSRIRVFRKDLDVFLENYRYPIKKDCQYIIKIVNANENTNDKENI